MASPRRRAGSCGEIEDRVRRETGRELPPVTDPTLRLRAHRGGWFLAGVRALFATYARRTVLGVALMGAQAFCYNAVFFTYALILTKFYQVPSGRVGLFMLPFALGNFLGPLLLGRLFDTLGRRTMITATYALSGVLMAGVGWLFAGGTLDAMWQTVAWSVIFFFASAAASSAYLTVGESFPLEVRAVAIAVFYALGTGARRRGRPGSVRRADRERLADRDPLGLPARRRADAGGGGGGGSARRERREALSRNRGPAFVERLKPPPSARR